MFASMPGVSLQGRTLRLSASGEVRVELFSVTGVRMGTLWNGETAGNMELSMQNVPSGLYVVKVVASGKVSFHKVNVR